MCIEKTQCNTGIWQRRAVKGYFVTALYQNGREILDIKITDQIGTILDIDPDEQLVRMFAGKCIKAGTVRGADIAPCCTQTGNDPRVIAHLLQQIVAIVFFKNEAWHAAILAACCSACELQIRRGLALRSLAAHGKIRVMSTILAIETSAERASAALLHRDTLIFREVDGVTTHSQTILPMVQSLLQEAHITLKDCDAIAYGAGPGSFTGVRTACGIAQGLAFGAQRPVIPLVTLLAVAHVCREKSGASDVLAVMDARMGEVYWAQYRYEQEWQIVVPPTLSVPSDVIPVREVTACGNGLRAYAADFKDKPYYSPVWQDLMPHAAQLAVLGARAFANGQIVDAARAEPLYLRNKVALTTLERQEKAERTAA